MVKGKRVCFLGYDRHQTRIVEAIEANGFEVVELCDEVDDLSLYDVVVASATAVLLARLCFKP